MRQRHLAVRNRPYRRASGGPWRMLIAAGVIAAVGYGAYTLMNRVGAHSSGQLGTFLIEDAYGGGPLPGARLTFVPLACQGDGCQPAETTARGVVGRMFSTNARGE